MTGAEVQRSASADELAERVAARLVETVATAQSAGRVPCLCLTGGTVAAKIHTAVARSPQAGTVDWSRVDVWFGDERYVPADDEERNAGQAEATLLDRLPFDPERVHPMPASDEGAGDLQAAASSYGEALRGSGAGMFDVVMLGVGPDGHVASLFPGFPQLDDEGIAVAVTGSPKPPPERISLTFPALNRSREVWFVVSGDGKADAVARALASEGDVHETPARGVRGRERTVWFLDEAAASRL